MFEQKDINTNHSMLQMAVHNVELEQMQFHNVALALLVNLCIEHSLKLFRRTYVQLPA